MSYGKRDMPPALREQLQQQQRRRLIGIYEEPFLEERCSACGTLYSSPLSCRYCALVKQGRDES